MSGRKLPKQIDMDNEEGLLITMPVYSPHDVALFPFKPSKGRGFVDWELWMRTREDKRDE